MIMNRGKEKWKRKSEERRAERGEDFIFLFAKGLFILLFWLTVSLVYVVYLEGLILVEFSSLIFYPQGI